MREYKFRGFNQNENGKETAYINGQEVRGDWVYGSFTHVHDVDGKPSIIPFGTNYFISVHPETVGQYTGLMINDQESFEGDIYEFKHVIAFRKWWGTLEEKKESDAKFESDLKKSETVYGAVMFGDGQFKLRYGYDSIPLEKVRWGELRNKKELHGGDSEERMYDFKNVGNIWENGDLLGSDSTESAQADRKG